MVSGIIGLGASESTNEFIWLYILLFNECSHASEATKEWLKAIAVCSDLEKPHQPGMQIHLYAS